MGVVRSEHVNAVVKDDIGAMGNFRRIVTWCARIPAWLFVMNLSNAIILSGQCVNDLPGIIDSPVVYNNEFEVEKTLLHDTAQTRSHVLTRVIHRDNNT